jgi:preprotein translocase subunit YajC
MLPVHPLMFSSIHVAVGIAGAVLAATAKKSSSGSFTIIFLIVIFAVGYMVWIRPNQKRRQRQTRAGSQISVGDKVILTSGIIGQVVGFVGDHARIEIAPGTVIEVVRRAVVQSLDTDTDAAGPGDTSLDEGHHDSLVDDSGADPYSVAPLESDDSPGAGDDDGHHPDADGGGGHGH